MTVWTHCYQDGWQGLIVADETPDASQGTLLTRGEVGNAFQHPAKVSRNLIQRLYAHLASHYGLRPGRGVLDPFAGTGLHALDALLAGYHFVGVEIEERFVRLAQANLTYWGHKFGPQPGTATVLHGDSRELGRLLGTAGCLVSSPPYNLPMSQDHNGSKGGARGTTPSEHGAFVKYGSTPGQLGTLPSGSLAVVLSSPPYEGSWHAAESTATSEARMRTAGYADAYIRQSFRASKSAGGNLNAQAYGSTPGQLGTGSPDTFWSAAHTIMQQCWEVLAPGAVACWICKGFVRAGAVVDFPGEWQRLGEACGFVTVELIHASLVDAYGTQPTLFGGEDRIERRHESFFRALARKKGAPAIDHEVVIIQRKEVADALDGS